MKFLFDLLPVLLFFAAYFIPGDRTQAIYIATTVAIVTSLVQVVAWRLVTGRYERMQVITLGLILVLGGATLFFHNPTFIKWKPTAVNWLFGIVLLGSQFIGDKNIVQRMMESAIHAPRFVWTRLNLSWVVFFLLLGCVNLYVAFSFSEEVWVKFKLFGMMGLTFAFAIAQSFYLARYALDDGNSGPAA